MIVKILFQNQTEQIFRGLMTVRYNPERGALIITRATDPNMISCPEIYKVPVSDIKAISAVVEER